MIWQKKIILLVLLLFFSCSVKISQAACGSWIANPPGCYDASSYDLIPGETVQCGNGACCNTIEECAPQDDDPFGDDPAITPIDDEPTDDPIDDEPEDVDPVCGGSQFGTCPSDEVCTGHYVSGVGTLFSCDPVYVDPGDDEPAIPPTEQLDPSDDDWPMTDDEKSDIIAEHCGSYWSYDGEGTCYNSYSQQLRPFVSCAPYGSSLTCCRTDLYCQLAYEDVVDIQPDPDEDLSSHSCGEYRISGYLRECYGPDGKPIADSVSCEGQGFPHQCCTSIDQCAVREADPLEKEDAKGKPFDYCAQIPDAAQRQACHTCIDGAVDENGNQTKIFTAVGCVRVKGSELAADLIKLFLGVGGGVALLTMIAAAFKFTISRGDSGQIKEAKELMTAAISGLLFIIFSVIILQFIGVEILRIPGLVG